MIVTITTPVVWPTEGGASNLPKLTALNFIVNRRDQRLRVTDDRFFRWQTSRHERVQLPRKMLPPP